MTTESIIREFLALKEAEAEATKAKKQKEAELRKEFAKLGLNELTVDGVSVNIIEATRTSYDADKLAQMVSPKVLKKVTKLVVDSELMESAVKVGVIDQATADIVTTLTPYSQVRVYPVSVEAKAKAKTQTQVSKAS